MWVLVFILLHDAEPHAVKVSEHDTLSECFSAREVLSADLGKGSGYFNSGQQAICIKK
jgi:hypothetical protein